jgi:hypothetical protein
MISSTGSPKQYVTIVPKDGGNRLKINKVIKKYVINGNTNINSNIDMIPSISGNQTMKNMNSNSGFFQTMDNSQIGTMNGQVSIESEMS